MNLQNQYDWLRNQTDIIDVLSARPAGETPRLIIHLANEIADFLNEEGIKGTFTSHPETAYTEAIAILERLAVEIEEANGKEKLQAQIDTIDDFIAVWEILDRGNNDYYEETREKVGEVYRKYCEREQLPQLDAHELAAFLRRQQEESK